MSKVFKRIIGSILILNLTGAWFFQNWMYLVIALSLYINAPLFVIWSVYSGAQSVLTLSGYFQMFTSLWDMFSILTAFILSQMIVKSGYVKHLMILLNITSSIAILFQTTMTMTGSMIVVLTSFFIPLKFLPLTFGVVLYSGSTTATVSLLIYASVSLLLKYKSYVYRAIVLYLMAMAVLLSVQVIGKHNFLDDGARFKYYSLIFEKFEVDSSTGAINKLLGYGTGAHPQIAMEILDKHPEVIGEQIFYHTHNQFLQTLVENGILGLLLLLIFMCYNTIRSGQYVETLAMIPFLCFGIVLNSPHGALLFFIILTKWRQNYVGHYPRFFICNSFSN